MVYLHHGENELIMPKYRVKSIFLSNLLSTTGFPFLKHHSMPLESLTEL